MNNQQGFIKIIIIAIIIVLAGAVGYFILIQKPEAPTTTEQPQTKDETADWQTYTNEKYGYRLNLFDSGYEATSNEYATEAIKACCISIIKVDESSISYQGTTFKPGLDMRIRENTKNRTVSEITQATFELNKENVTSSIGDITINGIKGKQFDIAGSFSYEDGGGRLVPEISVIHFVNNDYIYQLTVPRDHETLNKIMNSFEFLD